MGPRRRARRRGLIVGGMVGASVAKNNANKQATQDEAATSAPAAPAQSDMAAQLQELAGLKDQGIITQEEFDAKKKQILGL